jgi:predicted enzyme related to lactoylglutathione lyase
MSADNLVHRNNHIDYVELPAADAQQVAANKEFFTAAFGWKYQDWAPGYVDTHSSGVVSGIAADAGERQRRPLPVIYSDQLEAARAKVISAGATLIKDIYAFPGGRRFHFTDLAGNELAVWSDKQ